MGGNGMCPCGLLTGAGCRGGAGVRKGDGGSKFPWQGCWQGSRAAEVQHCMVEDGELNTHSGVRAAQDFTVEIRAHPEACSWATVDAAPVAKSLWEELYFWSAHLCSFSKSDHRHEELTPFFSSSSTHLVKRSQLHPPSPATASLTSTDYWWAGKAFRSMYLVCSAGTSGRDPEHLAASVVLSWMFGHCSTFCLSAAGHLMF